MKTKMNKSALLAAVVLVPLTTNLASAQYRIDNSQARDANNRVGSGGYNDRTAASTVTGNQLTTGNTTGGREFRGSLGYVDSNAFRGTLGSSVSDSFIRNSSGITTGGVTSFNANQVRPYFGSSTVAAPQGFQRNFSGTISAVDQNAFVPTDGRIDYGGATRAQLIQSRVSPVNVAGSGFATPEGVVQSPTAGYRDLMQDQFGQTMLLSEYTALARPTVSDFLGKQMTVQSVKTSEAIKAAGQPALPPIDENLSPVSPGLTGQSMTINKTTPQTVQNQQLEILKRRMIDFDSAKKLPGAEAAEKIRELNRELVLRRQKDRDAASKAAADRSAATASKMNPNTPRLSIPGAIEPVAPNPGATVAPEQMPTPPDPAANLGNAANAGGAAATSPPGVDVDALPPVSSNRIIPTNIASFSEGVADASAAESIRRAEALMRENKFTSAVNEFDAAQSRVPGDALVFMGRAIAELGASYYRRAELHLRQGFGAEKSLMLAQYDLRALLRDQRLEFLVSDLKRISVDNPKDPGPLLLLAFIDYNTGFADRAKQRLAEAQTRSGGTDELVKQLQETWNIETVEQNK